jgi:hypothetical protein
LKLIPFIAAKRGYDTFCAIISEDFCDLLAPYFSEDDLTQLQDRLFETVTLHETVPLLQDRLFETVPITESRFTFHQLIHLVDNIRNWCHHVVIQSLNLFAFHISLSGTSTALTALNRYNPSERLKTNMPLIWILIHTSIQGTTVFVLNSREKLSSNLQTCEKY